MGKGKRRQQHRNQQRKTRAEKPKEDERPSPPSSPRSESEPPAHAAASACVAATPPDDVVARWGDADAARKQLGTCGLANTGNTCYFNSMVQALNASPHMHAALHGLALSQLPPLAVVLCKTLREITATKSPPQGKDSGEQDAQEAEGTGSRRAGKRGKRGKPFAHHKPVVTPSALLGGLRSKWGQFKGRRQQDSHEALMCLLCSLVEESTSNSNNDKPGDGDGDGDGDGAKEEGHHEGQDEGAHDNGAEAEGQQGEVQLDWEGVFGGQLVSVVRCQRCGNESAMRETTHALSLEIPGAQVSVAPPSSPTTGGYKSRAERRREAKDQKAAARKGKGARGNNKGADNKEEAEGGKKEGRKEGEEGVGDDDGKGADKEEDDKAREADEGEDGKVRAGGGEGDDEGKQVQGDGGGDGVEAVKGEKEAGEGERGDDGSHNKRNAATGSNAKGQQSTGKALSATGSARPLFTLLECLRAFTSEEPLLVEAGNGYDCDACRRAHDEAREGQAGQAKTMGDKGGAGDVTPGAATLREGGEDGEAPEDGGESKEGDRESEEEGKEKSGDDASAKSKAKDGQAGGGGEGKWKGTDAVKRIVFEQLPPQVFICHLKRLHTRVKVSAHVTFPEFLDLEPYLWSKCHSGHEGSPPLQQGVVKPVVDNAPPWYRLFAVVEHIGAAFGGHYVAYVRTAEGWAYVSDSSVSPSSWDQVQKAQAYMVFYERCVAPREGACGAC